MININEVIETNKIWMCVRLLLVSAFWIVLIRI